MTTIRVMTANLWGPQSDPEGLTRVLAAVDPDVVAVQEMERQAADVIADHFAHHGLDPRHSALGSGVGLRYPATFERVPMAHRHGWSARFRPPGWDLPVELVAVHLVNPISWPAWRSVARRTHQVSAVLDHVRGLDVPTVVVGDMNATPLWPAYRRLVGSPAPGDLLGNRSGNGVVVPSGLQDAARLAGKPRRTWRWRAHGPPMLRIDHALVRGLSVKASTVVVVPGSDHLALVVDLAPV